MTNAAVKPATVDEYIAGFAPETQALLQRVRETVRRAAPDAAEVISYRIPALKGRRMLVYYAAFTHHIGFYPPVRGDAQLERDAAPYAGENGNLRFPLDKPLPLALIERITRLKARQDAAASSAARSKNSACSRS